MARSDTQAVCREVTMLCRVDRHTRKASFKVWSRTGVSGEDPPRTVLYEGDNWNEAYAATTQGAETVEQGLLVRGDW